MIELVPYSGVATPTTFGSAVQNDWVFAPFFGETDTITRKISSSSVNISTTWPTAFVESQLTAWHSSLEADVKALKVVVNFQRKYINYQATYNAFLLGTLTEDEFDVESNAYISDERSAEPTELADTIERLDRLLDFELTNRELGEYLEVDFDSVERAIASLEPRRIAQSSDGTALLPPSTEWF